MMYHIIFNVDGGCEKDNLMLEATSNTNSLPEMVDDVYDTYRQVLFHIWKRLEMGIFMTPNPNEVLSIRCYCDDQLVDEEEVHQTFFVKRLDALNKHQWKMPK